MDCHEERFRGGHRGVTRDPIAASVAVFGEACKRCFEPEHNGRVMGTELISAPCATGAYTAPCSIIASATLRKPAMLAPRTKLPGWPNSMAVSLMVV